MGGGGGGIGFTGGTGDDGCRDLFRGGVGLFSPRLITASGATGAEGCNEKHRRGEEM